jgi:hypothetical protein
MFVPMREHFDFKLGNTTVKSANISEQAEALEPSNYVKGLELLRRILRLVKLDFTLLDH